MNLLRIITQPRLVAYCYLKINLTRINLTNYLLLFYLFAVGVNCDTDLKSCIGVGCPNQGVCIPTKSAKLGFVCRCQEPYSSDCLGCSYGYGGPFCTPCNDSYTGKRHPN